MNKVTPIYASSAIQNQRLKACLSCDQFTVGGLMKEPKCNECGCFLKAKLPISAAFCPLNKWL